MIGIAIINYKSYQKTIECINSIRQSVNQSYKIYLLENASPNESAQILTKLYCNATDIELIISKENTGYARGNNLCIEHMRRDGCLFGIISNNDILCLADTIECLISDLKKNPKCLLVGPKIVDPQNCFQQSVKLEKYNKWVYLKRSTIIAKLFRKEEECEFELVKKIKKLRRVFWVSGAFFAFSIKNMDEIGGLDPNTFLYFEEYILAEKADRAGFYRMYDPTVTVIHDHGFSTGGGLNILSKIAATQSEQYYLKQYYSECKVYVKLVNLVRFIEVLISFGKRRDISAIITYIKSIKNE